MSKKMLVTKAKAKESARYYNREGPKMGLGKRRWVAHKVGGLMGWDIHQVKRRRK